MFRKSRIKIVAAIMAILVIVWTGSLGAIYLSSYMEMTKENEEMLRTHAEKYGPPFREQSPERLEHDGEGGKPNDGKKESTKFRLTTFYSVVLSYGGEVMEIRNEASAVYSDAELAALARNVYNGKKEYGSEGNLYFLKTMKPGYILVVFMDNTVVNESAMTLFRNTLIFGGSALVLFFFVSVFLARKIVDPLEESYQKQKQFISDAGHELKTPVSVVGANAELLSREIGENQWLSNIQYENERMSILVKQLLELARTENLSPQMEYLDLSRLVAGEALPFESVAFEKGLTLLTDIESGISVKGSSTQLKQIVSILLDNAIRHSQDPGDVRLTLTKDHGFARLSVLNKGAEIPKEQREKLFERFYRVDTARSGEDGHYGLGLAIAKAIAVSHNGSINVLCYDGLVEFLLKLPLTKNR